MFEESQKYETFQKELVRSKSELIIANTLFLHEIPYRYEYPVKLKNTQKERITVYPDFCCLNLRTREELYWEHFGLMDSPEYVQNAIAKLRLYAKNKIFPGRNLIITMETTENPLNTSDIENNIKEFLL